MKAWTRREERLLRQGRERGDGYVALATQLGRSVDSVRTHAWAMGLAKPKPRGPWYTGLRIGSLDIETANLDANAGPMLSWAIKVMGEPEVLSDIVTRRELVELEFDRRIVASLIEALHGLDIVVTYNGTRFDIPFIRSRAMALGLQFPAYGDIYHWDLYYTVKSKMRLHRKSLDSATRFLGIKGKTPLDIGVWFRARLGDERSLVYVRKHNVGDVVILDKLLRRLLPFQKWQRRSI